jgi:hypothetical protein
MTKPGKVELPLASQADIAELAEKYEACSLPYKNWTHRAHLALALFYLKKLPLQEATDRIRNSIKVYNAKCGDGIGYNETITVLFMKKIFYELQQPQTCSKIEDELIRLLNVCTVEWLYNYYSKELIWSDQAKQEWVEPDIKALDF